MGICSRSASFVVQPPAKSPMFAIKSSGKLVAARIDIALRRSGKLIRFFVLGRIVIGAQFTAVILC